MDITVFPGAGEREALGFFQRSGVPVCSGDKKAEGDVYRLAFLRNPINRAAERYEALVKDASLLEKLIGDEDAASIGRDVRALSFKEFVKNPIEPLWSLLKKGYVDGLAREDGAEVLLSSQNPEEITDFLRKRYDCVGLYEYLPLSLQFMAMQLGVETDCSELPAFDALLWKDAPLPIEISKSLETEFAEDLLIWRCAKELFFSELDQVQRQIIEQDYVALRERELFEMERVG